MMNKPIGVAASHLEPHSGRLQFAHVVTDGTSLVGAQAEYAHGQWDRADPQAIEDQIAHGFGPMPQVDLCAVDAGDAAVIGAVLERPIISDISPGFDGLGTGPGGIYAHTVLRRAGLDAPACILVIEDELQIFYADPRISDPCASGATLGFAAGPYCPAAGAGGPVNDAVILDALRDPFFGVSAPKAVPPALRQRLQRLLRDVRADERGATATGLAAAMVARGLDLVQRPVAQVYVAGAVRHDPLLRDMLASLLPADVQAVDALDIPGLCYSAQAMGFAAARIIAGRPIASPGTSGLSAATGSATIWRPKTD